MAARTDITSLVFDLRTGSPAVADHLFPLVYDELRRIAHIHLSSERPDHTLSTTALVHEAYLKLVDQSRAGWQDRAHFCAVASKAMRRILIDYARRRNALKRGGSDQPVSLDGERIAIEEKAAELLSLDESA